MKLNKLLMPVLGITALSGSIIPMASCSPVTPDEPDPEADFLYEADGGGCTIIKYIGKSDTAIIPKDARVGSRRLPITSIASYAFSDTDVKQVILGENVTTIHAYAFKYCNKLTSVVANENLWILDDYAFADSSITNIDLTNTEVEEISRNCFENCLKLKTVSLGKIEWIHEDAFKGCTNLTEITCEEPYSSNSIESRAFAGCTNLTNVTIPGTTRIFEQAFSGCTNLINLNWGASVQEIHALAFENCENLKTIHIPNTTYQIEPNAFAGCNSLTKITIGEYNDNYSSGTGNDCIIEKNQRRLIVGLKNTQIPVASEIVTTIATGAFTKIDGLKHLHIPSNINRLEPGFIQYCNNLESIDVDSGNEVYATYKGLKNDEDSNCIFANRGGYLDLVYAYGTPNFDVASEHGTVINIRAYAFSYTNKEMNFTLPDSVYSIQRNAFVECPYVAFNISESSDYYEGYRYYDYSSKTTRGYLIFNDAYYGKTLVKSWGGESPSNGYIRIAANAFAGENIDYVFIPSDVLYFEDGCFGDATIESLYIMAGNYNSYAYLYDAAFSKDCYINNMVIGPATIISGYYGLSTAHIKNAEFYDGSTYVPDSAFYGNKTIETITLPDSVTSIGPYAFYDCANLRSVNIPGSVSQLGAYDDFTYDQGCAFCGCSNLVEIDLSDWWGSSLPTIGQYQWNSYYNFGSLPSYGTVIIDLYASADSWRSLLYDLGFTYIYNWDFVRSPY